MQLHTSYGSYRGPYTLLKTFDDIPPPSISTIHDLIIPQTAPSGLQVSMRHPELKLKIPA